MYRFQSLGKIRINDALVDPLIVSPDLTKFWFRFFQLLTMKSYAA